MLGLHQQFLPVKNKTANEEKHGFHDFRSRVQNIYIYIYAQ